MTVTMTDDQFQKMIAPLWGITDSIQKMKFLRTCTILDSVQEKKLREVFEATREGEEAVPGHTHEQVVESTEQTRLKLDQMWPGTREWEVVVQAHTYERVVESTELTRHKLDQVWPGTREGEVAVQAHTYEQAVEST